MPRAQTPLRTLFGPAVTAAEAARDVEVTGRVALVTGGASGLGLETVRALAGCGATVVVPALDQVEARAALEGLERTEVWPLDLGDETSIKRFAATFLERTSQLDLLVLNGA